MRDPNPKVSGAGFKILRKAGVEVVTGVLEKQARRLNEFFIKYIITGKPFVILKGAMTLDGKIATARGDSKWITAEAARNDAHELRAQVDAVLVGAETLLHDDPMLTCRLPGCKRQPYRVVLDGRLRTPPNSNFCKLASDGKTIIAALPGADDRKARRLEKAGCRILSLPPDDSGHVSIEKVLSELGALEVASLLVEGGGTVNFSFLRSGCVDKVVVYIAPRLLGGADSKTILGGAGFLTMSDAVNLRDVEISTIGQDIIVTAYPKY
jgi:diaminohydroxyphosphoribosylaminopyrimidine deaminase/5-amino-6-(5-phosphoribosylamino)uracil reductase